MAIAGRKVLTAHRPCGCLSHCMIVDVDTTPRDVGDFWAKCHARGVPGREIPAGGELPAWECEVHERERRERMARRKGGA